MPYNEKLRRASTNAEVREIAENFSNLSKWMIIKVMKGRRVKIGRFLK